MTTTRYTPPWLAGFARFVKLMEDLGIHSYADFQQRLEAAQKAQAERCTHPDWRGAPNHERHEKSTNSPM